MPATRPLFVLLIVQGFPAASRALQPGGAGVASSGPGGDGLRKSRLACAPPGRGACRFGVFTHAPCGGHAYVVASGVEAARKTARPLNPPAPRPAGPFRLARAARPWPISGPGTRGMCISIFPSHKNRPRCPLPLIWAHVIAFCLMVLKFPSL